MIGASVVLAGLAEMNAEQTDGRRQLAATAARQPAAAEAQATAARSKADLAKDLAERIKRGEPVSGGIGKTLTRESR